MSCHKFRIYRFQPYSFNSNETPTTIQNNSNNLSYNSSDITLTSSNLYPSQVIQNIENSAYNKTDLVDNIISIPLWQPSQYLKSSNTHF